MQSGILVAKYQSNKYAMMLLRYVAASLYDPRCVVSREGSGVVGRIDRSHCHCVWCGVLVVPVPTEAHANRCPATL